MAEPLIAIAGASSLLGREVAERLEAGPFALARIRLLDAGDAVGVLTELRGEPVVTAPIERDSLEDADIVILCGRPEEMAGLLDRPLKAGGLVLAIGDGDAPADVPVVNMDVNPQALGALPVRPGRIAAAGPSALFLTNVLHAIESAAPLCAVECMLFEPASSFGREALDELFQQAANLMSFGSVPVGVLGRQLAFNIIPLSLTATLGGQIRQDRIVREIRRVLGYEDGRLALKGFVAPVFHGHSALVRVSPRKSVAREALLAAFEGSDLFSVAPSGDAAGSEASPVEWAGQVPIRLGEIVPAGAGAWWIWALADDLKGGAARNVVRIAEALSGR